MLNDEFRRQSIFLYQNTYRSIYAEKPAYRASKKRSFLLKIINKKLALWIYFTILYSMINNTTKEDKMFTYEKTNYPGNTRQEYKILENGADTYCRRRNIKDAKETCNEMNRRNEAKEI